MHPNDLALEAFKILRDHQRNQLNAYIALVEGVKFMVEKADDKLDVMELMRFLNDNMEGYRRKHDEMLKRISNL